MTLMIDTGDSLARPHLARAVRVFHALSDETRLRVLEMLLHGERCVCELQLDLDAAQSRLSFHLKVLRDAGLVLDRKDGRWMYYRLNPDAIRELTEFVQLRFNLTQSHTRSPCVQQPTVNISRRHSDRTREVR